MRTSFSGRLALRASVDVADAVARLRSAPQLRGGQLGVDELGHLAFWTRRDMLHLDADALNDRLAAWTQRVVRPRIPDGMATLSFRHARPMDPHDESTMDMQEGWHDLEPTFSIESERLVDADLQAFLRLAPEFLALVEASGRPAGWRRIDEGNAE
jgi:hypothetical protein